MDSVLYWNNVLLEATRRDFTRGYGNGQQPGPIRTSRAMAIVHLAIHDAVAFHKQPAAAYLNKKGVAHGIAQPLTGNINDIIAGAAVTTLKALYHKYSPHFDDVLGDVDPTDFAKSVLVGQAMLDHRAGDGWDAPIMAPQPMEPVYGEHRADSYEPGQMQLGPLWGQVKRFTGPDHQPLEDFPGKADAPDYLTDPDYRADFEEVRDSGSSARGARTANQQRIGVYWGYDGANNLGVPPRLYNQVLREILVDQPLDLGKKAELFAMVNVAMADAGIDAWHYKYLHKLWRPVVGIREEAAPDFDCFWAPLGAPQTNGQRGTKTPNFPAYPSGHATFGAAMFQALRLGLATGAPLTVPEVMAFESTNGGTAVLNEEFTFVSDELDGIALDPDGSVRPEVKKTFISFAEAVWENSVSRIYLGVHWRFDGLPCDPSKHIGGVPLGLAIGAEAHDCFNGGASLGKPVALVVEKEKETAGA